MYLWFRGYWRKGNEKILKYRILGSLFVNIFKNSCIKIRLEGYVVLMDMLI